MHQTRPPCSITASHAHMSIDSAFSGGQELTWELWLMQEDAMHCVAWHLSVRARNIFFSNLWYSSSCLGSIFHSIHASMSLWCPSFCQQFTVCPSLDHQVYREQPSKPTVLDKDVTRTDSLVPGQYQNSENVKEYLFSMVRYGMVRKEDSLSQGHYVHV